MYTLLTRLRQLLETVSPTPYHGFALDPTGDFCPHTPNLAPFKNFKHITNTNTITDRSFQYASPHLWNKLPFSLRELVSPLHAYLNPSFSSPLSPSINPSLFHSKLKTYLFGKSFLP